MPALKETTDIIAGPVGNIEIRYQPGEPGKPLIIICHPHPLHGGTMDNKVVYILAKTFAELGLGTLRFNFRGVGKSEGEYDAGKGESEDLLAVAEWFRQQYPDRPLWLAGFSFGAYVALRNHQAVKAEQLCLVAPPVTLYDFSKLPEVNIPWMVVQGGQDEVISPDAVADWLEERSPRPYIVWQKEAGHFFHGGLNALSEAIKRPVQQVLD